MVGHRQYSLACFILRYLWNKIMPIIHSLPEELCLKCNSYHQDAMTLARQERVVVHHIFDAASKQIATSISLWRHAWLRSATIPDDVRSRIEDLPFDGIGLFDTKTDEILDSLQKTRKIAHSYSSQGYRPARQPWCCQYTYQPYKYQKDCFRPQQPSSSAPPHHEQSNWQRPWQSFHQPDKKNKQGF